MTRIEALEVIKTLAADGASRDSAPEVGQAVVDLCELLKNDSVSTTVETGS